MGKKRVLDVGQCGVDHPRIRRMLESQFQCDVAWAHRKSDALEQLRQGDFDLVLVNRKLDADGTEGLEVVKAIKADPELSDTPVMLVTNYPEHQQTAVEAGATRGFGKSELDSPETIQRIRPFLT